MTATTIKIRPETKLQLDQFREHVSESYDDVIKKVIYVANKSRDEPKLSKETMIAIEKARERFKKGQYVTEEEAKKRLAL